MPGMGYFPKHHNSAAICNFSTKVCPIENNTNLNSIFCLIKSSKIDFVFLPAFYLNDKAHDMTKEF